MSDPLTHRIGVRLEDGWANPHCLEHGDCEFGEASWSEGALGTFELIEGAGWFPLTVREVRDVPDEPTWKFEVVEGDGG